MQSVRPNGVSYNDSDPLINRGTSNLRPFAGVEVSEDNIWIPPKAFKFVDSSGAFITLDNGACACMCSFP